MTALELRPILIDQHFDTCVRFRAASYRASFGSEAGLSDEMGDSDSLYRQRLLCHIAEVPTGNVHLWSNNKIIGQAEMKLVADASVGYVSLLYIESDCRRLGLGRLLHNHACNVFKAMGKSSIQLSVSRTNLAAQAFYNCLGWENLGPRPGHENMYLMRCLLT